jgi:type VI protein secretion system component VasK
MRGRFWKAKRPSWWLMALTAIDAIIIVALPFTKIGQEFFHFVALPIILLAIVFLEVICYFIVSEFVKLVWFRYWKPKDSVISLK